jgi:hypothetical protein
MNATPSLSKAGIGPVSVGVCPRDVGRPPGPFRQCDSIVVGVFPPPSNIGFRHLAEKQIQYVAETVSALSGCGHARNRAEECRNARDRAFWTRNTLDQEHRWCHSPYTRRCVHARALPDQRTQHARRRPLTPPAPCHESGLLSHAAVLVVVDRYKQRLQAQGQRLRPWLRSASRATHILPEGGGATASNAMTGCGPTCLPPPPRTRPQP